MEWPLFEALRKWMAELGRVGLGGGTAKETRPFGIAPPPDAHPARLDSGETVWVRPGAFRHEEGYDGAEVLEQPLRTDQGDTRGYVEPGGGEGVTSDGDLDEVLLREDYEIRRGTRTGGRSVDPANDRLLDWATAVSRHDHPDLDALDERERRELVVGYAARAHAVAKANREFQEYRKEGRA